MIKAEVLLRFHETPGIETLDVYRRFGGYQALAKAGRMSREDLLALIEASGLRCRGGAGFYSAKNVAQAEEMGVKRVSVPNRSTKSQARREHQKKRWFKKGLCARI